METLRIGLSYYRHTEDLQLQELVYKGKQGSFHYFHDQYQAEVRLSSNDSKQLNISRIMCLNDLEEKLRFRISYVHDQLRRAKQQFNPLDTVSTITTVKFNTSREIHQYDKLTGKYMNSYPTVISAVKTVTGDKVKKDKGNISGCARGERPTAFGYRWSYDKMTRIPIKKREYIKKL